MTESQEQESLQQISITILPDGRLDTWNAALYLGLSRRTLATWRYEKKGPAWIKRGRVFYRKVDLDRWLDGSQPAREGS
jgi:hypothetical protein